MSVRFELVNFMTTRNLGERVLDGRVPVPANHEVEQQMPEFLDAFARSVQGAPKDEDNLPAKYHDSAVLEATRSILEQASQATDPNSPELYPFGYDLLPTKIEHSKTPGILAVELAPMDMRHTTESLVGAPVAKLFLDTTPGQDGIEFLLTY